MSIRTIIATSTVVVAAVVLAIGVTTTADAATAVKRGPLPTGVTSKPTVHRTYHPPRGCLGDATCRLPGSYKGGQGWPDTGTNCTYTTYGGCKPQ